MLNKWGLLSFNLRFKLIKFQCFLGKLLFSFFSSLKSSISISNSRRFGVFFLSDVIFSLQSFFGLQHNSVLSIFRFFLKECYFLFGAIFSLISYHCFCLRWLFSFFCNLNFFLSLCFDLRSDLLSNFILDLSSDLNFHLLIGFHLHKSSWLRCTFLRNLLRNVSI